MERAGLEKASTERFKKLALKLGLAVAAERGAMKPPRRGIAEGRTQDKEEINSSALLQRVPFNKRSSCIG